MLLTACLLLICRKLSLARSNCVFVYEHSLSLLSISPDIGQINKVTRVSLFLGMKSSHDVDSDGTTSVLSGVEKSFEGIYFSKDDFGDGVGLDIDDDSLRCSWQITFHHSSHVDSFYDTFTKAFRVNDTYAVCDTPTDVSTSESSMRELPVVSSLVLQ